MPRTYVPMSLTRIQKVEKLRVGCFGSSLFENGFTQPNGWQNLLFNTSKFASGFTIPGYAPYLYSTQFPNLNFWTTPSGITYLTDASGYSGSITSITWDGTGGMLAYDGGSVNGSYTGSIRVRLRSGAAATARLYLLNKQTLSAKQIGDPVPLTSEYQLLSVTGVTDGATPGARFEIRFSGGGVAQMSDFNFSGPFTDAANITKTNYGLGGSNSRYSAVTLGRAVVLKGGISTNTTMVFDGYNPHPEKMGIAGINTIPHGDSTALANELFIIGLLPNGGTDRLSVYEGVVKQLRKDRREVLLVTDNGLSTDDLGGLFAEGLIVKQFATKYGCAIADSAAYMLEGQWRGEAAFADIIHQNDLGHLKWAESIAGIVGHPYNLEPANVFYSPQVLDYKSQIQHRCEVELDPTITGGTSTKVANAVNRLSSLWGQSAQTWNCSNNAQISFHHPIAIACDLVYDSSSAFTCEVYDNAGGSPTYSFSPVAQGVGQPVISVIHTMLDSTWSSGPGSRGGYLKVTSGTMKLCALVYHVPDYEDITSKIATVGTGWGNKEIATNGGFYLYTDTVNDYFRVEFEGSALAVLHYRRPAAGTVEQYFNGTKDATDLTLTNAGASYFPVVRNTGNTSKCTYMSRLITASAGTPGTGDRRLSVIQMLAVKDRTLTA
jgi:hypothetical protein